MSLSDGVRGFVFCLSVLGLVSEAGATIVLVPGTAMSAVCVTESEASDLDGDGFVDLIALNVPVAGTKLLYIYPGTAPGVFSAMPIIYPLTAQGQPWGLEIGDVNLDGIKDILIGDVISGNVVIMLGNGAFDYTTNMVSLPGSGSFDLIAADYSGDGILDLLLPGSWNLSFNYARGDGTGQFSPDDTITVGAYSATAAVGDLDLDGLIDLVIPHMNGGFIGVNVYLAISPGEFVLSEDLSVPGSFSMWSIDLADFNNDGYLDIVIPDEQIGGIRVWINDGSGNFGMSTAYPGGGVLSANSTTADFDLDGNVDVAVAGNTLAQGATNIVIFKGDGIGGFTADSAIPSQDCYTLNTADIDLDGRPDLIAANGPVNTVTPYHNETDVGGGGGGGVDFKRGDCNIDGSNNVADAVSGLQILFMMGGTPLCIDACDFNDDGSFNIADPIGTLSYLFDGGPAPPPPNFNCGEDPSADSLTCMTFSVCP